MTGAGGPTKRYSLRSRRPNAVTDAERLQTTAPAATTGSHHSNNGGATEADSTVAHMSKHIRRNKRNIFRFADLPAEIRNEIYDLSLKTDLPIALCTFDSPNNFEHEIMQKVYSDGRKTGLAPNILLLNKATYVEAGAILYGNHLCFHSPMALFIFLSSLSSTPKGWLQELTFSRWASSPSTTINPRKERDIMEYAFLFPAFTALNGTASLKNLHMEFSIQRIQNAYWTPRRAAVLLYSDMHFWLHALSKEKSSIARVVELIDIKIVDFPYRLEDNHKLWSFPGCAKHADESVLRTSMLREHLVQCMDGRLTWQMLSELEPISP